LIQDGKFITSYLIEGPKQLARIKASTFAFKHWPAKDAILFNEGGTVGAVDEQLAATPGLVAMPKMKNAAFDIAPSPTNAIAATLHQGLTDAVRLWNFETGQEVKPQFRGSSNEYSFSRIAFTPDGQTLVGMGQGLTLLDLETRKIIGSLRGGHSRGVKSFAMSSTSLTAASGSYDGGVLIWDLNPSNWAARACLTANRNQSCTEWRQFHGSETYRPVCPGLQAPASCD
jgi:hypothetical protein